MIKTLLAALFTLGFADFAGAQIIITPLDNDFSDPNLPAGTFQQSDGSSSNFTSSTPWVFSTHFTDSVGASNQSGVAAAGATSAPDSGGQNLNAPAGTQAAYLQNVSYITQDITLSQQGDVYLTLDVEGRATQSYKDSAGDVVSTSPDEIQISLNGVVLYDGTPTDPGVMKLVTTDTAGFAAGTYQLKIAGVTSGVPTSTFTDSMSFVSNVEVAETVTPEPSAWAMLLAGCVGLGGFVLRRNKRLQRIQG